MWTDCLLLKVLKFDQYLKHYFVVVNSALPCFLLWLFLARLINVKGDAAVISTGLLQRVDSIFFGA